MRLLTLHPFKLLHVIKLDGILIVVLLLKANKFLHKASGNLFGARLAIDVVHLVWVVVKVVELPTVDVVVEVHKFVTI